MTIATEAGGDTSRRFFLAGVTVAMLAPPSALWAQQAEIWSAKDAHDSLINDLIRLVDIRSGEEWADTGVAQGAWPISLHEDRFPERLFAARELADGRPVALICATGGRSGYVSRSLREAGYSGFIDVSEGMLGSPRGPGWIASKFPTVSSDVALRNLPAELT
ncbi:rhodanese-like domain-containing protein [Sulfitobacter mediterraneus]|uniref:rhodanese-like domain-containing protein n=2 Tax=Sulfitobacter mediterraneus TaxID=83219 RepID=UPI001932B690|nr:rhodanese-like domain-containing protein [Sulfitobacter mediterraneus]MBM1312134.1 rhodanese-like domain-containing protein [Sulfitobacter mediterraneus]MBM1316085.1 rhodanese-like domain-containing protein [Sulfitobacter mediterraneus]MBM1324375.1 rhodanese-like domain-containing protein [Sulfitobacter mediterraneus]MBM1328322.1 rhodanese-like domain-containing protein [Sulfitobacter mediterraneus]MBM1399649.1 rhodanese-like domain-containing protein [Sulfitobacter mediterraneus]